MDPAPGALLVMALVLFVPGGLLYLALKPRGSLLEAAALAPALSLAFVFLMGEACMVAGLPFDPLRLAVPLGVIGAAAAYRLRGRAAVEAERVDSGVRTTSRQAGALLVLGMLLSGLTWLVGLQGQATTPPNRDSANHGVMVTQVASLETMDPSRVLSSELLGGAQEGSGGTSFYPLALHGEVALAHRLAGVGIAAGLLAAAFLFGAIVLPIGVFLLTRALVPRSPVVAGLAALLVAGTGCLPLAPMYFGGMTLIAGMAMVPVATVVATRYLINGGDWAAGLTVALVAVGIAATHTSEAPLLAIFCGALLVEEILRGGGRALAVAAAQRIAGLGFACVVLMLPSLGAFAGGTAERSGFDESPIVSLPSALRGFIDVVSFPSSLDLVVLLALAGLGLCVYQRRQLAMAFSLVLAAILYVVSATLEGPIQILTLPWYHHPARLAFNAALLVPVFGAIALSAAGTRLARLTRKGHEAGLSVLLPSLVAFFIGVIGMVNHASAFRIMFDRHVLVDSDAIAAFSYLGGELETGEQVLNDSNNDGGLWMYAFEGVPPLLGLEPARPSPSWRERSWLLAHLPDLATDPKVAALLGKHNVRFVYLNDRHFDRHPHVLTVEATRATARVCERVNRGTAHVFEVVPEGDCA